MEERAKVGRKGEDLVCGYLMQCGHSIIERNWRCGHLEIDIISLDSIGIHFVEVKSRKAPAQADPQDNVGFVKQRRIASAARQFLAKNGERFPDAEVWFDVAAVTFFGQRSEVEYFPNAYVPTYL